MEAKKKVRLLSALAVTVFLVNLTPARANDGPDWLNDPNELPKGVVSNDNMMLRKDSSAAELLLMADRSLKSGKIDRAIDLIKRSLDLDNEDLDAHMSYATALERKLASQTVEDPAIFNRCVKEWLAVLRNKYGEEKSETIGGVGIPGINGRFFADDERQGPARNHLIKLTGSSPKPWETDAKFLAKVQRHGEATVSGKMLHDTDTDDKAAATVAPAAEGKKAGSDKVGNDPNPDTKTAGAESGAVGKSSAGSGTQPQ